MDMAAISNSAVAARNSRSLFMFASYRSPGAPLRTSRPRPPQAAPGWSKSAGARPGRVLEEEPCHSVYGPEDGPHANTQSSGRDPRDAEVPDKVSARDRAPRISNPHEARP
jgi:hypothetical protein